jgi:hypothetical protein
LGSEVERTVNKVWFGTGTNGGVGLGIAKAALAGTVPVDPAKLGQMVKIANMRTVQVARSWR